MIKCINESCFNSPKYIQKESVDLFFCDPPYFISGGKNKNLDLSSGSRKDWDRQWSSKKDFYDWTHEWMRLMHDQLKLNGSAYICICWEHSGNFKKILEDIGFNIKNRITWKRDKGRGSSTNWKSMHEDVWFVTKSKDYVFNVNEVMVEKKLLLHIGMKKVILKTGS